MDHQAFAQLLGNYGEFVGAIAVVVTLGYLAHQINLNTRALKSNAYREVSRAYADHSWDIARDRSLAEVMFNQLAGTDQADAVAELQSAMVLRAYLMRVELLYDEVQLGVGPLDRWVAMRDFTRAFLDTPKVREMWEADKLLYGSGFVAELDGATPAVSEGAAADIAKGHSAQ